MTIKDEITAIVNTALNEYYDAIIDHKYDLDKDFISLVTQAAHEWAKDCYQSNMED